MNIQFPVQQCQYCGSTNIGLGWQHGEALVTFKKHGLRGNRLQYLICRRCGAVLDAAPAGRPCPRQAACLSRYLPQSAARWPVWRHGLHHYRSLCRLHLH